MIPFLRRPILPKLTTAQRGSLSGTDSRKAQILYDTDLNRALINVAADGAAPVWEQLNEAPRELTVAQFRAFTPSDLDRVIVRNSQTAPVWWHEFIYNADSSSPYKWECIGGIPIRNDNFYASDLHGTDGNWYVLAGDTVVNPYRAGEWEIEFTTRMSGAGGTAGANSLQINGVNPYNGADAWGTVGTGGAPVGFGWSDVTDYSVASGSPFRHVWNIPVDDAPVRQVHRTWNGNIVFSRRFMWLIPQRVV